MNSHLESLPSITGNLGNPITILHEFAMEVSQIDGGTRLTITSLRTDEVQTVDILNGYTPQKGVDYWTEEDQAEMTKAAEDAAIASVVPDPTLSEAGKAAEAAAVGGALTQMSQEMVAVAQGEEHAGKLLFVDTQGNVTVLGLGAGLEIMNGTLIVTSNLATSALCGQAVCGITVCGGM